MKLRTDRLILRRWSDADTAPFARLNGDPQVMRFFPSVLTPAQSDALAIKIRSGLAERGWGLWAVEAPGVAEFIGFVGLNPVPLEMPFAPAVEVGWRLDEPYWGYGYATEAARAALEFAFTELRLEQVVSFTAKINVPSRRVMERLGMTRDQADDFDHPFITAGPLRRHVLYKTGGQR